MKGRVLVAVALVTASLAATGCSTQGAEAVAACQPVAGTATTALTDDRGALAPQVWVPVVTSGGHYASSLKPFDVASRSLTTAELGGILAAKGKARSEALAAAVADIPRGARKPAPSTVPAGTYGPATENQWAQVDAPWYRLWIPSSAIGRAVGDFYAAALDRQGYSTITTVADPGTALAKLTNAATVEVALFELPDLARELTTDLPAADLTGQMRAVAGAAARRSLAVGSPTSANRTPQVLVTQAFAAANGNIRDLSGLARSCPGLVVAATDDAAGSLGELVAPYGLREAVVDEAAVDWVRSGLTAAALAQTVSHAG